MTKPEPQDHNVNLNVRFEPKPPKPPKRHRFLDICAILFAAALIATVTGGSVVFAIVGAVGIVLYLIGERTHNG